VRQVAHGDLNFADVLEDDLDEAALVRRRFVD